MPPNEKEQEALCLHAGMTQSLPVLFALLVVSLSLYYITFFVHVTAIAPGPIWHATLRERGASMISYCGNLA